MILSEVQLDLDTDYKLVFKILTHFIRNIFLFRFYQNTYPKIVRTRIPWKFECQHKEPRVWGPTPRARVTLEA